MMNSRSFTRVLLMFGIVLAVAACSNNTTPADTYKNISLDQAYEGWQQRSTSSNALVFLDVRTPEEFAAGHVPGAMNIPIQVLQGRLNEVPKNTQIYLHCEAGGRSAKAAKMLVKAGIHNFENMPAGMRGWRDAGYPVEK